MMRHDEEEESLWSRLFIEGDHSSSTQIFGSFSPDAFPGATKPLQPNSIDIIREKHDARQLQEKISCDPPEQQLQ